MAKFLKSGSTIGIRFEFLIVILIIIIGIILVFKYIGQYYNIITIAISTIIKAVILINLITITSIIMLR
jgi:hypothetical protein